MEDTTRLVIATRNPGKTAEIQGPSKEISGADRKY